MCIRSLVISFWKSYSIFFLFKNLKHRTTANEIQAHKIFQRSFHFSQILSNVIVLKTADWIDFSFFKKRRICFKIGTGRLVLYIIYKYHNIKYEDWRKISIFICFTNIVYILGLTTLNYGKNENVCAVFCLWLYFFSSNSLLNSLTKWTSKKDALFLVKITIVHILIQDSPYYTQLREK